MGTQQADDETAENGVDADDLGKEGGGQCDEKRDGDHGLTGSFLQTARVAEEA